LSYQIHIVPYIFQDKTNHHIRYMLYSILLSYSCILWRTTYSSICICCIKKV